jgi:hypothetical protein
MASGPLELKKAFAVPLIVEADYERYATINGVDLTASNSSMIFKNVYVSLSLKNIGTHNCRVKVVLVKPKVKTINLPLSHVGETVTDKVELLNNGTFGTQTNGTLVGPGSATFGTQVYIPQSHQFDYHSKDIPIIQWLKMNTDGWTSISKVYKRTLDSGCEMNISHPLYKNLIYKPEHLDQNPGYTYSDHTCFAIVVIEGEGGMASTTDTLFNHGKAAVCGVSRFGYKLVSDDGKGTKTWVYDSRYDNTESGNHQVAQKEQAALRTYDR